MLEYKVGAVNVEKSEQEKLNVEGTGQEFIALMKEDFNDPKLQWSKIVDIKTDLYTG